MPLCTVGHTVQQHNVHSIAFVMATTSFIHWRGEQADDDGDGGKKEYQKATGYQLGPPPPPPPALCPIQHMNRKGKKDEKVSVDARQKMCVWKGSQQYSVVN